MKQAAVVWRRLPRRALDERGVIGIQLGIAMLALLGFAAFATDYGVMWLSRGQSQNAADAAALAAATALAFDDMIDSTQAEQSARSFAARSTVWGAAPASDVSVCADPYDSTCATVPGLPADLLPEPRSTFSATVSVYRDQAHGNPLPTYLASLFGVENQAVRAQATATVAPANVATCVWPLAMPDDWTDLHPADPALPLPSICTSATDQRCKPFSKYKYPDGPPVLVTAPTDAYVAPALSSDDFTPTGYQLLELEEPMKPTGLDPQIFVDLLGPDPSMPGVWLPARRSSLAPVRIGGESFTNSLVTCNQQPVHLQDELPVDPTASWALATAGAETRLGQDGGASWDDTAARLRGSCALSGSCGSMSPRLVLIPMFDPDRYDATRASGACGGYPCIRIVNFIGLFIDAATSANQIVGHLMVYPGRDIDMNQPFVGYKWAFLRTAVLTR